MYLLSIATASPEKQYTQQDCFEIFSRSRARDRLKERSVRLMEKVLLRDNGIQTRRFSYPDIDSIFDAGPEKLNNVFEQEATKLGSAALQQALERAELPANDIDALVVCTCTGYLCPGLSSHIAEKTGLPSACELTDVSGMGCGAAIPSLRQASHFLAAHPDMKIAVIAVEICSAAFYLDDTPGVIISACLFGDGAAATIWSGGELDSHGWMAGNFRSVHIPEDRELLRFENANGALRNRLSKHVPEAAGRSVRSLYDQTSAAGQIGDKTKILPHTGGRDVLDALEKVFPATSFGESRTVLRDHGNMSSPSVLFVLNEYLESAGDHQSKDLWLTSFGAGFSAYSMTLKMNQ